MKQIIKSATVYKADIGMSADALGAKLQDCLFAECLPTQILSFGFVPVDEKAEAPSLIASFKGGFAFRVRIDQKQIPGAVLKRAVDAMAEQIQQIEGRKPGKKERAELKDAATVELAKQTFARTASITCFYEESTGYLIVPTTSSKHADVITHALVKAAGSVKTETIHISSVKHGLTARLKKWSDGDNDAFGVFNPCAEAALKQDKRKLGIKMGDLQAANSAIKEAMASSFEVSSLGLTHKGATEFRLTEDFRLKGIQFAHTEADDEDGSPSFYAQATLEMDALSAVITDLIDMIGHGEGHAESGAGAPAGTPEVLHSSTPEQEYANAVMVVQKHNVGSVSLVQRKLGIGYNRAAELLERMQAEGIVSAMDESGARKVLKAD